MQQEPDIDLLTESIAQKSMRLMQQFAAHAPVLSTESIQFILERSCDYFAAVNAFFKPEVPSASTSHSLFELINHQYRLVKQSTLASLEQYPFHDENLARRMQFYTNQAFDALEPQNFVATNPDLIEETLRTQGKNLLQGLDNLLADLDNNAGTLLISMTDKEAFQVGVNIATTPGQVIFRNELIELIQYTPQSARVKSVPLLIIPPWINKYYILDLSSHNSLIKWLVEQNMTVFVLSWINPGASLAHKTLSDYLVEGPVAAIEIIKKQLKVQKVNALGYCIGGTLLSMLLAYYEALGDASIQSATFLASLIDFSDPGEISVFINEQQIKELEKLMQEKGYFSGYMMAQAFNSLRAHDLIWSFFIKNYLYGKRPAPFDILYWNMDNTNMPSTMHSEYLRGMYLDNALVKPGAMSVAGVLLDLTHLMTPVFFVSTEKDHIAPWKTTYRGFELFKGPKRFLLAGSGHVAGIIIPPGTQKYGFKTNPNAPADPDTWLLNAVHHNGSWWPEWFVWLKKHSGRLIAAPVWDRLPFKGQAPAPGTYVRKSSLEIDE